MASGEAISNGFAVGGAAVGGDVTTVRGGAWFCAKPALTLSTKYSPTAAMRWIRDIVVLLEHHLASDSGRKVFTAVVIGRKAIVFSRNFLSDLENRTIIHESGFGVYQELA
jgi:hypothetical protein